MHHLENREMPNWQKDYQTFLPRYVLGFQILNCAITRDEGRIATLYNRSRLPLSTPVLGGGVYMPKRGQSTRAGKKNWVNLLITGSKVYEKFADVLDGSPFTSNLGSQTITIGYNITSYMLLDWIRMGLNTESGVVFDETSWGSC